jgi:uncharacterized membrane protein
LRTALVLLGIASVGIALVARTSWMNSRTELARAVQFDRVSRAIAVGVYAIAIGVIMATSFT